METVEEAMELAGASTIAPETISGLGEDYLREVMLFLPVIMLESWCSTSKRIHDLCTLEMWAAVFYGDFSDARKPAKILEIEKIKSRYTSRVLLEFERVFAKEKRTGSIVGWSELFKPLVPEGPFMGMAVMNREFYAYTNSLTFYIDKRGGHTLYKGIPFPQENRWVIYSKTEWSFTHHVEGIPLLSVDIKMDPEADNIIGIFREHDNDEFDDEINRASFKYPLQERWLRATVEKFIYRGSGEHKTLRAMIVLALKKGKLGEFLWRIEKLTYYGKKTYVAAFEPEFVWNSFVNYDRRKELFFEFSQKTVNTKLEPRIQNDDLEWNTRSVHLLGESVTELDRIELHTISAGESGDLSFLYNASPEKKDRVCEHNLPQDQFIEWLEYKRHKNHPCPMCDKMGTMKL